jgi:hypothetical protein
MKNIICIDLTKYNQSKLQEVASVYKLNYDFLDKHKKADSVKIWIDLTSGILVAFTTKKITKMIYSDEYMDYLSKMDTIVLAKKEVVMDVDSILDKITKYGIASLTVSEKVFLDGQ